MAALLAPCAASASPCLYVGTDDSARVIDRSGEMTTPFPEAIVARDCTRLRVASGVVNVYGLSDSVQARSPREVREGGGALASPPPTDVAGGERSSGLLRQIITVLEGNQRARLGSSRSGDEEHVVAALPSGRLGEPATDLIVALGPLDDPRFERLELLHDGKLVHQQRAPARELRLPAQHLKAGRRIQWQLRYAGQAYRGDFTIESTQTLAAAKEQIMTRVATGSSEVATLLHLAAGLTSEGFVWNARDVIRTALQPPPSTGAR